MLTRKLGLTVIVASLALANLLVPARATSQQVATLHSFNPNTKDGAFPDSSLTL